MSRYSYAGKFVNPTEGWFVKPVGKKFGIFIRQERKANGSAPPDRRHTTAPLFAEHEDAVEYITDKREFFEEDYDAYLDENHDSIVAMERYEAFRNEF